MIYSALVLLLKVIKGGNFDPFMCRFMSHFSLMSQMGELMKVYTKG